ncbi:MAG: hypothetical protein JKY01_10725 [Pseudomonadales bacterium]|nr:hypothetical protein [Pseudomonadales bacterium]
MKNISVFLIVLLALPSVSFAGEKELKNALSKAQYMLRQANAEKISVEKDKREVQLAFDEYKKNAEKERKYAEKGSKKASEKLNAKIGAYKEHYEELKANFIALRKKHRDLNRENSDLAGEFALEKKKFGLCLANNHKLFDVNKEILGKYENKGFFSILKQNEPMMGLSKVQIENLVQEYQYDNEDLLVLDY